MITKRKHIPVWLYKTAQRLDKQSTEIETTLANINVFNVKKQSQQAIALLEKWYPEAEHFTAQIKTVEDYIKALERAEAEAKRRIQESESAAGK